MNHVLTRLKGIIFTYLGETEMSEPGLLLQAVDKCVLGRLATILGISEQISHRERGAVYQVT